MGRRSSQPVFTAKALVCAALLMWCGGASAAIHLSIERLSMHAMTLDDVQLTLEQGSKGRLVLHLTAGRVDMAALGWHNVGLQLQGVVTRAGRKRWQLDGTIALDDAPGNLLRHGQLQLTVDAASNTIGVLVSRASTTVNVALPLNQPTHARIELANLPLRWLQGLLAGAWSGQFTSGRLDGVVALDIEDDGLRSSGDLALTDGGFDSRGGKLAGQGLNLKGNLTIDTTGKHDVISTDLSLHDGQVLLGPMYIDLPDHDVHLAMEVVMQRYGISLRHLRFTDPDALHLVGSMVLGSGGSVRNIHFGRFSASLPSAYERYGKAWLATLGFSGLHTRGQVSGSVWMDANGLRSFRFDARQVDIRSERLAVSGLDGGLDWRRDGNRPATTLAWRSLGFYDIALGAASGRWQSRDGTLSLQAPLVMPVLGGQFHLRQLAWNPAGGEAQHLQTAFALTDVDVAKLCAALGWPKFTGTLAGAVPGLRYVGDHIELDGGLSLNVFGGYVDVTQLSLQDPFGAVPVLAGTINMHQLNLASLTSVFDFGRITGRLDGHVKDLRMVGWKPVAFEASLRTTGDGGEISQRAVHNLTAVGGGGMASGLQAAVLKLFDSFGYSRIGLSCTLEGSVCHMSGLKPVEHGYLIVEGRGLPHLTVIGHERRVSWPILVSRLKAAINSGGPVVE